ncbi:hypothetical protein ACHAWF_016548 [Thalassiosira exigua]
MHLLLVFAVGPVILLSLSNDVVVIDAFTSSSRRGRRAPSVGGTRPPLDETLDDELASRHPLVAKRISDPNAFIRRTEDWFPQYLGVSKSDLNRIDSRLPNGIASIYRLGRRRLQERMAFFLSKTVGLSRDELQKLITSRPQLLTYKLSNLENTVLYFREELGLSSNELASVLKSYPSVLMYSVDKRLRPTVDFLQNECGGGKDNWASWKRVVCSYPAVFSHSLEKTLLPNVEFLCRGDEGHSLGLSRSELSQVIGAFPPTLWLSKENLKSKLDFLTKSLGLTPRELQTIIVSYPSILGLSLQRNLIPKMYFFLDATEWDSISKVDRVSSGTSSKQSDGTINCGLTRDQLKGFVMYQPALLGYSLENRIKPRIRQMQERNIL